jgi:hypothetical protein
MVIERLVFLCGATKVLDLTPVEERPGEDEPVAVVRHQFLSG